MNKNMVVLTTRQEYYFFEQGELRSKGDMVIFRGQPEASHTFHKNEIQSVFITQRPSLKEWMLLGIA